MSYINVDKFSGYASVDPSAILNPNVSTHCAQFVIENGMLKSFRRIKERYEDPNIWYNGTSLKNEKLCNFIYWDKTPWLIIYNGVNFYWCMYDPFFNNPIFGKFNLISGAWFRAMGSNVCNLDYRVNGRSPAVTGNMIQVGKWLYVLGRFGNPDISPTPRIPRIRMDYQRTWGEDNIIQYDREQPFGKISLVGCQQPYMVEFVSANAGGSVYGTYDFAFTFVNVQTPKPPGSYIWETGILGEDDLESNATLLNNSRSYYNNEINFKIYLPKHYIIAEPSYEGIYLVIGIYVKKSTESVYYFSEYLHYNTNVLAEDDNGKYIVITVDSVSQDFTRAAPVTGEIPIAGAHDVPKGGYHACYFKGRMYYSTLNSNELQISQKPGLTEFSVDRPPNYIESIELIGRDREPITGFVEFLGQMIIFKQSETYILTDDYFIGKLIKLDTFGDKGCVNKDGGHAYIVINGKLYFGDKTGIYVYDGINPSPIRISEAIQNDLERIDRYRYSFMRFSDDPRLGLLIISFPMGFLGLEELPAISKPSTFYYHYNEDPPCWTKSANVVVPSYVLNRDAMVYSERTDREYQEDTQMTYYVNRTSFEATANKDDYQMLDVLPGAVQTYQKDFFTKDYKLIHWVDIRIEGGWMNLQNENVNAILTVTDLTNLKVKNLPFIFDKTIHIGIVSKKLRVTLNLYGHVFLNGISIQYRLIGRR